MITLSDYWGGRDATHPLDMTPQIERNALITIELANKLLTLAKVGGVTIVERDGGGIVNSGWRPPAINAKVGGAKNSMHMSGEAIDIHDPVGRLDDWMDRNPKVLIDLGLWVERRDYTPTWAHLQSRPPASGSRFFIPRPRA